MSKPYLASLTAINSIPQQTSAQKIQSDIADWLAQGGQIKTVKPVGSVEGELPPPNTAASRVLEMLRADALTVKREGAKELG